MTQPTPSPVGPTDIATARTFLDTAVGMSEKERREGKQWVARHEAYERGVLNARLDALAAANDEHAAELSQRHQESHAELATLVSEAGRGRHSADSLREALKTANFTAQRLRAEADALSQSTADIKRERERDPVEVQADRLRRFPNMRNALPVWLGEMPTGPKRAGGNGYRPRKAVDPGAALHAKADALMATIEDGLRALKAIEERERELAGMSQATLERFPAMKTRS